ncbi:MAG: DUF58 domain-containing protein [Flavobacteriales bacterium]
MPTTRELLKKIRRIEIKTKGLSDQVFSGEYHSAFKGRGMAFSEVREYMPGDDIRTIDWNVTARFDAPYVKIFEEERELTSVLLIDVSGSENFGTQNKLKRELITEVAAVLSFSAIKNNDKIGVILFSDHVEKFIPPKKGKSHILRIIKELLEFEPTHKKTNINEALAFFMSSLKKKCIAFLISDFYDEGYENKLKIANRKHDMVGIRIQDEREREIPPIGVVQLSDPETGKKIWVNTGSKKVRKHFKKKALQKEDNINENFCKAGMDNVTLTTDGSYVKPLMKLFKQRGK